MNESKNKRVVHFKLHKDYGNFGDERAWTFKEWYDGKPEGDPNSRYVLRKEDFKSLQKVIENYLEEGFTIEINNK